MPSTTLLASARDSPESSQHGLDAEEAAQQHEAQDQAGPSTNPVTDALSDDDVEAEWFSSTVASPKDHRVGELLPVILM